MDNPWGWIYIGLALIFVFISFMLYQKVKVYKNAHNKILGSIKSFLSKDDRIIVLKDSNLKYIYVNHAFKRLLNISQEKIIGFDDCDFLKPEISENSRYTDLAVLKQKNELTYDVTISSRIYCVKKFPITLLDGSTGVGIYAQDVTDERIFLNKQKKVLLGNKILVDLLSQNFDNRQQQLNFLLDEILKFTDSREGYIKVLGKQGIELSQGLLIPSFQRFNAYICSLISEKREPLIVNDFPNSIYRSLITEKNIELRNFIAVPLIIDKIIVAVICLGNKPSDYDEFDIIGITLLLSEAWHTIIRKEAEEKLIFERDKYLQTLVSIDDGVIVTDQNGIIEMQNKIAENLTGRPFREAVGRHYSEIYTVSRGNSFSETDPVQKVLQNGEAIPVHNNVVLMSKEGNKYDLEESVIPIRNNSGKLGAVLIFRDVTDKKLQRSKIEYLSFHDSLTGLYNRRFFEEELKRLDVSRNLPLSIIMGDVNGLKLANDIFGHTYGDMLIKKAANVLKLVCRADDIIARLDGDEFVILLPRTTPEDASNIISRIKEEFSKEQVKLIKGNLSMGMDTKHDMSQNIYDVYKNAEENMYTVKAIEIDQFSASTLELIMSNLYENSPAEKRHCVFVSKLSAQIGKQLNLLNTEIKKLQDAGYYHDIGKITLSRKLLRKHVNLTEREWNEIKKHPITGYRILTRYNSTVDLAEIVLAHQERYDGLGYPKGLKGEEIPLASRIIAIAESFERRLSGDDANAPFSVEDAQKYIKDNAGTRFDPALIDAFLTASTQFDYYVNCSI